MAVSFLRRVQATPKIRAVKKKIRTADAARKVLSRKYRSLIKSESRRLGKKTKTAKKAKKRKRR